MMNFEKHSCCHAVKSVYVLQSRSLFEETSYRYGGCGTEAGPGAQLLVEGCHKKW